MHPIFIPYIDLAYDKVEQLLSMPPYSCANLPKDIPKAGIYLFTENGKHLYVGRSNNIKARLSRHSRSGATHRMAAFAFLLAREQTGNIKPTYKAGDTSRNGLSQNPIFAAAFVNAKARIRQMEVRFVEEVEPTKQAILEIYAAVVLGTPYNSFDTH